MCFFMLLFVLYPNRIVISGTILLNFEFKKKNYKSTSNCDGHNVTCCSNSNNKKAPTFSSN